MDIDSAQPTRNSPFIHYFDITHNFPWQDPRPEQIRLRRALLYDSLIFDILLNSGGIHNSYSLYPPKDQATLQELLDAIEESSYDALKKDCLIYFLLKWHQDGREKTFSQQRCIPPQFAALADAYWHLDTGINIPRAVSILSDARLNRDYASTIIRAISLAPDSAPLIRKYVQTAKPLLVEPPDIECYTLALAEASILDAWQYIRTYHEMDDMRPRLFKDVLAWTVTPGSRPVALKQLINLPLSPFEESVLNDFVKKPPPDLPFPSVAILQELICVRLIQSNRYTEAIKLDRDFASTTPPKNVNDIQDRVKMVQDIYAALPSVERALLDLELDPTIRKRPAPSAKPPVTPAKLIHVEAPKQAQTEVADSSLSHSWQDIRLPESLTNKSTPLRDLSKITQQVSSPFSVPLLSASASRPSNMPFLPIDGTPHGSSSGPLKTLPLSSVISSGKPRTSAALGNSTFGTPQRKFGSAGIASPASSIKLPNPTSGLGLGHNSTPSSSRPHTFVSASSQQNAFYRPPPQKTNGVKRTFGEGVSHETEEIPFKSLQAQVDEDLEMEEEEEEEERPTKREKRTQDNSMEEEEEGLEFSVFSSKPQPTKASASTSRSNASRPAPNRGSKRAPPGSILSDEEEEEEIRESRAKTTTKARSTREVKAAASGSSKPAKRPKQVKETRHFPGAFDNGEEENEEEDQIAPLRPPSPPAKRAVRKGRSSASIEVSDEMEGIQTRRRSSRLTTGGGSVQGSPEPPSTKARKSTRTSGNRKKRS